MFVLMILLFILVSVCVNTHGFGMILNGTLTVISFLEVSWAISPKLFMISIVDALAASSMEDGVIGKSAMAFATLLGAFSLVITQFQAISSYASVVARLGEFVEYAERCDKSRSPA